MSLVTSTKVRTLQRALYVKAKAEPGYRFYSLHDKVHRQDILEETFTRCRTNGGSAGVDGEDFEAVEVQGRCRWLAELRQELKDGTYRPKPLRRVWIPKANGTKRPLGIPCIRDRVARMAVTLVLQAIFEADLPPRQFRRKNPPIQSREANSSGHSARWRPIPASGQHLLPTPCAGVGAEGLPPETSGPHRLLCGRFGHLLQKGIRPSGHGENGRVG